ncbi:thioredoxin-like protein [Mycena polygramma]|nr:thioredoxin-like protein [Mycena polygramma]
MFSLLPTSLFLVCLALQTPLAACSTQAASPSKPPLTHNNFAPTISQGVWFVEHFSPYSAHCRAFAPTWETLASQSIGGVQLARVDCSISGDLCQANGALGYPQLNLYRNGTFVEHYRGPRSLSLLTQYLAKNAAGPTAILKEASAVGFTLSAHGHHGTGVALNRHDFRSTIAKGVWFVQYFSPYCGHCEMFGPTWEKLVENSEMFAGVQLGRVDCIASEDLCHANGIMGYPEMRLYRDGELVEIYAGRRDFQLLVEFLSKAAPPQEPKFVPGQVALLDRDNFTTALAQGPAFVKFYMPWCRQCTVLAPTWTRLAKMLEGRVTVAEVDCSAFGHFEFCQAHGITAYPTLAYYHSATGTNVTYDGLCTVPKLAAFAEAHGAAGGRVAGSTSIMELGMQYLYSADAYMAAHPLRVVYMLSLLLGIVYVCLRRFLQARVGRAEPEFGNDKGQRSA